MELFCLLTLLLIRINATILTCTCEQLLSQNDCQQETICKWTNNLCKTISQVSIGEYCTDFTQTICPTKQGCMYYDGSCQHLTGCISFKYTTNEKCQALSATCISDNSGCIPLGDCRSYVSKTTCKTNANSALCFWDGKTCADADTCTKLPYTSDSLCRAAKSSCTVNANDTACMDAGNCKNMQKKTQCVTNLAQTIKCVWVDNTCKDYTCTNASITLTSDQACESYLTGCTTTAGGGCVVRKSCSDATNQAACVTDQNKQRCTWMESYCNDRNCSQASKTFDSNELCSSFLAGCIVSPNNGCMLNKECGNALIEKACKKNIKNQDCIWDGQFCQLKICQNLPIIENMTPQYCEGLLEHCTAVNGKCIDKTCDNAGLEVTDCGNYLGGCIPKQGGGCVLLSTCDKITVQSACIADKNSNPCFWQNEQCINKMCNLITHTTSETCSDLYDQCINGVSGSQQCVDFICKNISTQDRCVTDRTQRKCIWKPVCYKKNCYSASTTNNTHSLCNSYLSTCTVNSTLNGCMELTNNCSAYTIEEQCHFKFNQKACTWVEGKCQDKTCQTADQSNTSMEQCNSYITGCVVQADLTGCMDLPAKCETRLIQEVCLKNGTCLWVNNACILKPSKCSDTPFLYCNSTCIWVNAACTENKCDANTPQSDCNSSAQCFWNGSGCVALKCANLTGFETAESCTIILNTCTLDGSQAGQCKDRSTCDKYLFQSECYKDVNNKECIWSNNSCISKSCSSLVQATYDHVSCWNSKINQQSKCTVNSTSTGCISLSSCTTYTNVAQCVLSNNQESCIWNGSVCQVKTCTTATTNLTTHQECNTYLNTCTVNVTNSGCQQIPSTCAEMTQQQCQVSYCIYFNNQCVDKECSNAPTSITTATQCQQFLDGCTYSGTQVCYDWQCEDEHLATHSDCFAQFQCTSNGNTCTRLQSDCAYYNNSFGCVVTKSNIKCTWNLTSLQCETRTCDNAPNSLITDSECIEYMLTCTTKANGGCIARNLCADATVQAACVKSITGTICTWDSNKCRDIACQDLSGTTHSACQSQMSGCSLGINDKCTVQTNCALKTTQKTCILGSDGPCLWIATDSSETCYQYNDCTSIKFATDAECKKISSLCTTNGFNCTPITTCALTAVAGCYIGTDGTCIIATNNNTKVCQLFTSCSQAQFATHADCQIANPKCTTDTITSCINLKASCSDYTYQEQCHLNNAGKLYTVDQNIKSTGVCVWENGGCRDQTCTDLTGQTNTECFLQLYTCTSNTNNCITISKCAEYQDLITCNSAAASDGICIWAADKSNCRIKLCSDIASPTSLKDCQNQQISCVYDGTKCVSKSNCNNYVTETACLAGGISVNCIWSDGKCSDFTQCSVANSKVSCAISNFCNWVNNSSNSTNTTGTCGNQNCTTHYNSTGKCEPFLTFNLTSYNYCSLVNKTCEEIDSTQFSQQNCYIYSLHSYTWNPSTQKCQSCSLTIENNSSVINQTNQTGTNVNNDLLKVFLLFFTILV